MFNLRNFVLLFALLALTTVTAVASPIVFVTLNGEEFGGEYGPYNLSITGTAPVTGSVLGLCLTDLINIGNGQQWQAEEVPITDFSNTTTPTFKLLQEDAYLDNLYAFAPYNTNPDIQAIHQAAWDISLGNTAFNDPLTLSFVTSAQTNYALAGTNWSVLIPVNRQGQYVFDQGVSQTFLIPGGGGSSQTPEPVTMLMLGTALILLGCKRHRKN
jgi:hypothetical protein